MNRKWMVWTVVPVLLTFLYGCPKKKPVTPPADLDVETTTVPTPAPAPSQPEEVEQPMTPEVNDQAEDPLLSSDMQTVNEELRRRGFSADIYFDYDESTLSDDTRDKLSRNADLLKGNPQFSVTLEGHADSRGTNEYNLALGERRVQRGQGLHHVSGSRRRPPAHPLLRRGAPGLHRRVGELLVAEPPRPHGDHGPVERRLT